MEEWPPLCSRILDYTIANVYSSSYLLSQYRSTRAQHSKQQWLWPNFSTVNFFSLSFVFSVLKNLSKIRLVVYGAGLSWNHSQQSWEWHKQKTDVRGTPSQWRRRGYCFWFRRRWKEGTWRQCFGIFDVILSQELYISSFLRGNANQFSGRILEHQVAIRHGILFGIEELEKGWVSLGDSIFCTHFSQYGNDVVDVSIAFPRDHCMRWVETKVTLLVLSNLWRRKTKQRNLHSVLEVTSSKDVWTNTEGVLEYLRRMRRCLCDYASSDFLTPFR